MSRLNVHVFDHAPFMVEVTELVENILGRPVYEIEDWRRLLSDCRSELNLMRNATVAQQKTLASPLDK